MEALLLWWFAYYTFNRSVSDFSVLMLCKAFLLDFLHLLLLFEALSASFRLLSDIWGMNVH